MHAERNHCAFLQNADEVFITVPPHSYKPSTFPLHKGHHGIIIYMPKAVNMSTVYIYIYTYSVLIITYTCYAKPNVVTVKPNVPNDAKTEIKHNS